ncbi:MMPL family transporter [Streptomyces sp. BPTC-684]|uniref:MMPL family transporter n=1 Tax=Streptomyces sp. BPTC-684 TaxID=3043734 RepID=UPI0024B077AE|nr:MMPL family transporter [Streptomyces sp. BPTC-684]WHM41081.1 MMPL family transporter [Streptomyces sp. BPTC-684]
MAQSSRSGVGSYWAGVVARRPVVLLLVVLSAVGAMAYYGTPTSQKLSAGIRALEDPHGPGAKARGLVEEATRARATPDLVVLVPLPDGVTAAASRTRLERLTRQVAGHAAVASAASPLTPRRTDLVGRDGWSALLTVTFRTGPERQVRDSAERLAQELGREPGLRVSGLSVVESTMLDQIQRDLRTAELVAFPLLFALSLWVFRSVVAATLPLLAGGAAIAVSFGALRLINTGIGLSAFISNLVVALTLGLAIDFALLMVNRFREELARTGASGPALARTLHTVGRAIVFSALTVSAALASLLVFPQQYLYSMGIGGIVAPLVAVVCTLLILPPLLVLLGPRVDALAPRWLGRAAARDTRPESSGPWFRLAHAVMRRPVRIAALAAAALLLGGLPVLGLEVTGFSGDQLPGASPARQALDAVDRADPAMGSAQPYLAVRAGPEQEHQLAALAREVARLPEARGVGDPRYLGGGVWRIDAVSTAPDLSEESRQLVARIREVRAATPFWVGGTTADFVDELAGLKRRLPWAAALLVTTTLLLLLVFTRSAVLPLKSLVMSLLSLATATGVLVVVFQWIGLGQPPGAVHAVEASTLVLTLAVTFGLSTDYGVLLLSRIAEGHAAGLDDTAAIAHGLERVGRLVTSAALLFAVAVGAFAGSQLVYIKELAVGAVTAVIVDATLVRALLVPALMRLLGSANWWAPSWIREGMPVRHGAPARKAAPEGEGPTWTGNGGAR